MEASAADASAVETVVLDGATLETVALECAMLDAASHELLQLLGRRLRGLIRELSRQPGRSRPLQP